MDRLLDVEGPDPVIELYKKGVDRTLLRENLRRSPDERLRNLEALQRFADELRRAGKAMRNKTNDPATIAEMKNRIEELEAHARTSR